MGVNDDLLKTARIRFDASISAESRYRKDAVDDQRFVDGDQWPDFVKNMRKGRVIAVVNKTRVMRNNVVNRAMDVNLKPVVVPKKGGTTEKADIFNAIITGIFDESKSRRIIKAAVKDAATSGLGFIRILPEYDSTGFYQNLKIKHIINPLSVYMDSASTEYLYGDSRWMFITGVLSEEEFNFRYPNAKKTNFTGKGHGDSAQEKNWHDQNGIVVAEYFYRVPQMVRRAQMVTGEVFELSDEITEELIESTVIPGTATPENPEGVTYRIEEIREIEEFTVMWCKITGNEVLEEPRDLKISKIPIIPVIGYSEVIEGERINRGVVYDMRDPQRMYNYNYSSEAEVIANQPKAPYVLFDDMLDDHTRPTWDKLATSNPPYLLVKRTPGNVMPRREQPPVSSSGNINYMERADRDMHSVSGIFPSAIGSPENARSKVAIKTRQIASTTNTKDIIDNMVEAVLELGTRLIEWIPIIYDTEQTVLVSGKPVVINQTIFNTATGEKSIINDLSEGNYSYSIQPGTAGFTTRQEQLLSIQEFTQNLTPEFKLLFSDIIAELSDMPSDIIERMKGIVQSLSKPPEAETNVESA